MGFIQVVYLTIVVSHCASVFFVALFLIQEENNRNPEIQIAIVGVFFIHLAINVSFVI